MTRIFNDRDSLNDLVSRVVLGEKKKRDRKENATSHGISKTFRWLNRGKSPWNPNTTPSPVAKGRKKTTRLKAVRKCKKQTR